MGISNEIRPLPTQERGVGIGGGKPHKLYNNFYVSDSKIHGKGLFAKKDIPGGTKIEFSLPKTEYKTYIDVRKNLDEKTAEFFLTTDSWVYDIRKSDLRFINHSETPNIDWWDGYIFTLRDISKDEEVFIDYGWEEKDKDNKLYNKISNPDIFKNIKNYYGEDMGKGGKRC